ncbi:hypothetical protein [Clostridium vincentii]|uniref:Uncharacterized protein n=1 Tax=Clostridium vincentii TaxID=52704 RepID=A0A2T0BB44_9CLOT|nr:hypothetical protein [Clostridium vincentii]PRR81053.1 hypothetical protein CLVI_28110 [Clostridium vincentii]
MKLIWKGKFTNEEQLFTGNLPDNAAIQMPKNSKNHNVLFPITLH